MSNLQKEQILEKIDLYDVFSKYIDVSKAQVAQEGWVTKVCSPFRDDKTPSFSFNIHHGGWKDFAGGSGDVFGMIQHFENTDFKGSLKYLEENYIRNYSAPTKKKPTKAKKEARPIPDKQLRQFTKNLLDGIYPEATEVVKKRGITDRVIKEYRIGSQRYFYKKVGLDIDEIIIPYKFDESGNAIEYKKIKYYKGSKAVETKNEDGTSTTTNLFAYTSGSAQIFPNSILENDELVLVEGELDALVLLSLGINAVTGTAGSKTFTKPMADKFAGKKVTVCYDNDTAGDEGAAKALRMLNVVTDKLYRFRWVDFEFMASDSFKAPSKYDVSDYVAGGKDVKVLKSMLKNAGKVEIDKPDEEEDSPGEIDKQELADYLYKNTGTENDPKHSLVKGRLVNYIMTEKKICSTREGTTLMFFEFKDGYWNKISREKMRNWISTELLYYFTTHRQLNEVVNLLGDMTHIEADEFNTKTYLVNLKNCTFDTRTMKTRPHDPKDFFTYKNIYDYNPTAKAPNFFKAIREYSLNDDVWIDLMGEVFGYCLTAGYHHQKMFWWFGGGRNGKGTLIRVLEKMIGLEQVMPSLNPKGLDGQFALGDLRGKKLAFEGDMGTYLPNTNILKQLTGGDRIRTDQKFKDSVSFFNEAKIILLMNNMLQVPPGQSLTAIFRRIILLPFDYQIEEGNEDSEIEEKFEKELPGIFNWAVESLKRLKKNKQFTELERGKNIIKMHKNTVNAFMHFFDSKVVFEEGASIWGHELYKSYSAFMDENYGKQWQMGRNFDVINSPYSFGKEIKNQFSADYPFIRTKGEYSAVKGGKATKYYGIRLINQEDLRRMYNLDEYEDDVPF